MLLFRVNVIFSVVEITFIPPATILRQGNVFTPICHSVHMPPPQADTPWADKPPWADTPTPGRHLSRQTTPLGQTPLVADTPVGRHLPVQCMLGDTINKWAVRILLECNLVGQIFDHMTGKSKTVPQ